jgi:hypothetical protein
VSTTNLALAFARKNFPQLVWNPDVCRCWEKADGAIHLAYWLDGTYLVKIEIFREDAHKCSADGWLCYVMIERSSYERWCGFSDARSNDPDPAFVTEAWNDALREFREHVEEATSFLTQVATLIPEGTNE